MQLEIPYIVNAFNTYNQPGVIPSGMVDWRVLVVPFLTGGFLATVLWCYLVLQDSAILQTTSLGKIKILSVIPTDYVLVLKTFFKKRFINFIFCV